MTTRRRFRPWLHIPLTMLLGGGGVLYYGIIDRPTINVARDDWKLKFSYVRWGCRTCLGRVEHLECQNQIVSTPTLKADQEGNSKGLLIETPVGAFEPSARLKRWRFMHDPWPLEESDEMITAEELERGYYGDRATHEAAEWRVPSRKKGTPRHWCRVSSNTYSFWLDPARLDELATLDQSASSDKRTAATPTPITTKPSADVP